MKITTDGIGAAGQVQNARAREKTSGKFDEILSTVANKESGALEKTSSSQPVFQVNPVLLDPVNSDDLLQRLEGSLAALESYQTRLGDATVPIHELQPLVEKLEEEQSRLQSQMEVLPDGHPVKDTLNRSIVTMAVEVQKYRRGDFG
jgi:hypothetical protein